MASVKARGLPRKVKQILSEFTELEYIPETRKVKCSLSGHEMPCKEDIIESYVNGKRFKNLRVIKKYDYNQHLPHLVPSIKKGHEHHLFCKLTLKHINKRPRDVMLHVNGRKFKNALYRWEEFQKTGKKFISSSKMKAVHERDYTDMKNSEESDAESDNLSDLYPDEYFSGPDFEMMEVNKNSSEDERNVDVEQLQKRKLEADRHERKSPQKKRQKTKQKE